jgi:hypothetical protein
MQEMFALILDQLKHLFDNPSKNDLYPNYIHLLESVVTIRCIVLLFESEDDELIESIVKFCFKLVK